MKKNLLLFIAFGCLGITTEIFFTAFMDNIESYRLHKQVDVGLKGYSYIWMFPIYGFGVLFFKTLYVYFREFNVLFRLFLIASLIILIEFLVGFLLDALIGKCPWHYDKGIHILGFARLDYLPFWMIFAFFMERIYLFLLDILSYRDHNN